MTAAFALLAAAACAWAIVRASLPRATDAWERVFQASAIGLFALALSGAAWSAGLLAFGWTQAQSDLVLLAAAVTLAVLARGPAPQATATPAAAPTQAPLVHPSRFVRALWALVALAALLVAIFVTEHFLRYPDGGWDARAIWNHHARLLARVPHRLDLVFAPEHNHADYPLLLPGLVAHLWLASGNETPLVPALVAAAFALLGTLALLSSVHTLSARWFERDALPPSVRAASVALLLLGTPIFLTQTWIQCADLPLAMLTLLAIALVLRGSIAAAGLAAGLGALTKNDGALWLAALALVLLSTQRTSLPRFMRGTLAPIAALAHLKLRLAPENDLAQNARGEVLVRLVTLSRWWDAVKGLAREVWHVEAFGISLMAALAISVLLARGLRTEPAIARLPRKFLTPALLAILVVYVVGAPDVDHMARNSADRLLFQLWPTALLALALGTRLRLRADVA